MTLFHRRHDASNQYKATSSSTNHTSFQAVIRHPTFLDASHRTITKKVLQHRMSISITNNTSITIRHPITYITIPHRNHKEGALAPDE